MSLSKRAWGGLLFILFFLAYLWGSGQLPVTDPVESNYALSAKEMFLTGDWLSPQIYHKYWYDKPVFVYWGIALAYKIFGVSAFAARFPAALAGALTIAFVYYQMNKVQGEEKVARYTAMALGSMLMVWVISHAMITDAWLLLFTAGTFFYAYRGLTEERSLWMILAYAFAGLAVLTKGPVGLVLPGILLLVFVASLKKWNKLKYLFAWQGIVAFFVVAVPWYFMMYQLHGNDFIVGFLGLHNVTRATVSEHPSDNVWWYYVVLTPVALLPWTGATIYGMWKWFREKLTNSLLTYSCIWALGTMLFYSVMATKYPTYTYISLLPFAIFAGYGACWALERTKAFWTILGPAIFLWVLWTAGSFFSPWKANWTVLYVLVFVAILSSFHVVRRGKKIWLPAVVTVATLAISQVVLFQALVPFTEQRSMASEEKLISSLPSGDLYYYGNYSTSLVFYTGRDIISVPTAILQDRTESQASAWSGKWTMPKVTDEVLLDELQNDHNMRIIVQDRYIKTFEDSPVRQYVVPVEQSDKLRIFAPKRGE